MNQVTQPVCGGARQSGGLQNPETSLPGCLPIMFIEQMDKLEKLPIYFKTRKK